MGASLSKKPRQIAVKPVTHTARSPLRWYLVAFGAAFILCLWIYGPSMNGPFVFDDQFLPYDDPTRINGALPSWITGVRPLLYFTFWLNHVISGAETWSYHLLNIVIHVLNCALVFVIFNRLLRLSETRPPMARTLAGFAAGLFLLHPIQSESVAYIASRSETLSALFMLAAYAVFIRRIPGALTWRDSMVVLLLFGAACLSKEHAVVLAPVLLLTDYFWNPGGSFSGIRRNWRLYVPMGVLGLVSAASAWHILSKSPSAGFGVSEFTWYEYFFTQCRVFFDYIGLFALPVGLTVDHDIATSKTILDHGTLFALLAIVALACLAFYFRKRYPLATFGILLFILFLAPTSSFIPIRDPMAEHRMYLPVMALTLPLLEVLRRVRIRNTSLTAACMALLVIFSVLTYSRAGVWSSHILLWKDAVEKSPNKFRPYSNLAFLYMADRRCADIANLFQSAPEEIQSKYQILNMWGEAEACLFRYARAADLLGKAARLHPDPHLYVRVSAMKSGEGKVQEAYDALSKALELNPSSEEVYIARGNLYQAGGRLDLAAADFRHALDLNPGDRNAQILLDVVERRFRSGTGIFASR